MVSGVINGLFLCIRQEPLIAFEKAKLRNILRYFHHTQIVAVFVAHGSIFDVDESSHEIREPEDSLVLFAILEIGQNLFDDVYASGRMTHAHVASDDGTVTLEHPVGAVREETDFIILIDECNVDRQMNEECFQLFDAEYTGRGGWHQP